MGKLIILRHGETEWSRDGRHTGRTDVPLTPKGEEQARTLAPALAGREFALVLVSPAQRARRTAEPAGLTDAQVDENLWEWDYGAYEGLTTPEIQKQRLGWYLWTDGVPGGETFEQIGARADAVLERVLPYLVEGDVALVAHGHILRVLTARRLGLTPDHGRLFKLDTGTVSALGTEHDRPAIASWNVPA